MRQLKLPQGVRRGVLPVQLKMNSRVLVQSNAGIVRRNLRFSIHLLAKVQGDAAHHCDLYVSFRMLLITGVTERTVSLEG